MKNPFKIIVPGGLNTDIIGMGVDRITGSGELTLGGSLKIGPGGKARNMAQMAGTLLGEEAVAMMGKTVRDPFGLWKVPMDSLESSGVNIDYIDIKEFDQSDPIYPGIALIPVDKQGNNQIYVLPGISSDFSPDDVFSCRHLFEPPSDPLVLLALEIPMETVLMVLELSQNNGLKVILDPGGIESKQADILKFLLDKVFLLKPNEHEAEILTGIRVKDFESASGAAQCLLELGTSYVLITQGEEGGYLFGENLAMHIPIPETSGSGEKDATGCGDQVSATLAAAIIKGYNIEQAARIAIKAGTMQFNKSGINPIPPEEIFL